MTGQPNDLARKVLVRDVSYKPTEPDQFCTIGEFIGYNFDGSQEGDDEEALKFMAQVLNHETYRLDVGVGTAYDIRLAD